MLSVLVRSEGWQSSIDWVQGAGGGLTWFILVCWLLPLHSAHSYLSKFSPAMNHRLLCKHSLWTPADLGWQWMKLKFILISTSMFTDYQTKYLIIVYNRYWMIIREKFNLFNEFLGPSLRDILIILNVYLSRWLKYTVYILINSNLELEQHSQLFFSL